MKLNEYIKAHKIHKDTFIALYNKDKKWIICCLQDEPRFSAYLNYEVTELEASSKSIVTLIMTDYANPMQIGYYDMKASEKTSVILRSDQEPKGSRSGSKSRSRTKK